jgi:iron complex transport system substrate-binding protein
MNPVWSKFLMLHRFLSCLLLTAALLATVLPSAAQDAPACEPGFRLFDHEYLATEPVCIPEDPQRIIAIDSYALESLLALGITPVGSATVAGFRIDYPDLSHLVEDVADIGRTPSLEAMLALNPDLILAIEPWVTETYDEISQIAPLVSISFDDPRWPVFLSAFAAATNAEENSDEALATFDHRVEVLGERIASNNREGTISVILYYGGELLVYNLNDGFELLETFGLTQLPEQAEVIGDEWRVAFSREQLNLINSDYIIMVTFAADEAEAANNAEMIAQLEADPLWQTLSAVQNGNLHFVDSYWITATIISQHRILDDLFTMVARVDPFEVAPNPFRTPPSEATPEATEAASE